VVFVLFCQHLGSNAKFVALRKEKPHDSIDEIILNYLMSCGSAENYIDFIAIANTGVNLKNHSGDSRYIGSVAGGLIRKSNLNILFFA
jgi:hypothetical protein